MRYTGKVTIKADGEVLDTLSGASIDIGGIERQSVVTDQSMGYSENNKPSTIECEIPLGAGRSVEWLRQLTDATCVFDCDTGQSYIVKAAYTADTLSISKTGVKLKIVGEPAEEMVS